MRLTRIPAHPHAATNGTVRFVDFVPFTGSSTTLAAERPEPGLLLLKVRSEERERARTLLHLHASARRLICPERRAHFGPSSVLPTEV